MLGKSYGKKNRSMKVNDVTNKKKKADNRKSNKKTRRKRKNRNLSLETKNDTNLFKEY